ncbi:hypothetical protein ABZY58_11030 [Micromonospora tulbaghiae]|uniref:hypothetical protein n=1 Tax=Micromonospora tulbaghiae TaxID=479978 RepID=UPI0033AEE5E5
MISRLVYVCCDRCGLPADMNAMADDAREARLAARRFGFVRRRPAGTSKPEDLCPKCAAGASRD